MLHPSESYHVSKTLAIKEGVRSPTLWYTNLEVMTMKLPPIEKISEALSVIADQRYVMYEDYVEITSSNHAKTYTVLFHDTIYASNDAATYWQGYPGYPILAVWFLQGILPLPNHILPYFKDIDWNERNKRHKRNYANALKEVFDEWHSQGIDTKMIQSTIDELYQILPTLPYEIQKNTKKVIKH